MTAHLSKLAAWLAGGGLVLAALPPQAYASDYGLFPVRGVMTPSGSARGADLATLLDRPAAGQAFADAFSAKFPNVVSTIAANDRWKTFTVAFQVNRLSKYTVGKPNQTTDVYVAVTGTVYFANVLTGEILFSYSGTNYAVKTIAGTPAAVSDDVLKPLVRSASADAMSALLDKARARFNPFSKTFTVKGRALDGYILSGGAADGLRSGDTLLDDHDNSLSVVYADASYAIARPELGSVNPSANFTKLSNTALSDVKKPAILVTAEVAGDDTFDNTAVEQQFTDAVGDASPFSVVSVSPQYSDVVQFVSANTGISDKHLQARKTPSYFAHLVVQRPLYSEVSTNIGHKTLRTTSALVSLRIMDAGGRVIYADAADAHLVDEVVSGITFDRQARAEIALRNAMAELAERAKVGLKFQKRRARVTAAEAKAFRIDAAGADLQDGTGLTVLTPVSPGVFAPTWSAHITAAAATEAAAEPDLPITDKSPRVRVGDVVEFDEAGAAGASRVNRPFGLCEHAAALGNTDVEGFDDAALASLVASGQQGIRDPIRIRTTLAMLKATGVFAEAAPVPDLPREACFQPVNKIDVGERQCTAAGICRVPVNLKVGFRIRHGNDIAFKLAIDEAATSSAFPQDTSAEDSRSIVTTDIRPMIRKLLTQLSSEKTLVDASHQF